MRGTAAHAASATADPMPGWAVLSWSAACCPVGARHWRIDEAQAHFIATIRIRGLTRHAAQCVLVIDSVGQPRSFAPVCTSGLRRGQFGKGTEASTLLGTRSGGSLIRVGSLRGPNLPDAKPKVLRGSGIRAGGGKPIENILGGVSRPLWSLFPLRPRLPLRPDWPTFARRARQRVTLDHACGHLA